MKRPILSPDLIVILAGVSAALHVGKLPPAIPVLREALGITLLEAGFLLSLVQLAGMSLGLAVGLSADSLGLRRSMLAGLTILAAASAMGGWATGAADLLWLRAVEGLGFLLVVLPAPSLIRQLVPPERLSLKLGMWGAYMPFGTAAALFGGPWVMAAFDWQGWWWSLAALSAIMSVWMALGVPPDGRRQALLARPVIESSESAQEGWLQRMRLTLSTAGPWLVALAFAMYSNQWLSVIGFLPSIYAQAGLSGPAAGALTAFAAAVNVLGNLASGRLLHAGMRPAHLLYAGFAAMALGTFLAFGLPDRLPPLLRYAAVLLFSSFGGLVPATLFSLAVHLAPNDRTISTTVGWMQQCQALGQFIGPPLVAWVAGVAGGWQWTWTVTGTSSIVGMLLAAKIARLRQR